MVTRMGLLHSCLLLVSFASAWCAVYAQTAQGDTGGSGNSCPADCTGTRYWWTTMWDFLVTLFALTLDGWGVAKIYGMSTLARVYISLVLSVLNSLMMVCNLMDSALMGNVMLKNLRGSLGQDVVASVYPWSKSSIRVVLGAEIFVNISREALQEVTNSATVWELTNAEDLSEALVFGLEEEDDDNTVYLKVRLNECGFLALLRSNVLPPYDQLKFLRGNSSLAMAIAAVQAVGYIYGTIVRRVQRLRVSPVEAITCVLNIVVLLKVVLHNFASLGLRPLLLHFLPEQEARFIKECKNVASFKFDVKRRFRGILSVVCESLSAVMVYFIVFSFVDSLKVVCVMPIVIFEVLLLGGGVAGYQFFTRKTAQNRFVSLSIVSLNSVGYIWALVVRLSTGRKSILTFKLTTMCPKYFLT